MYLSSLLCEVYTCVFFAIIAKCNFSCNANCTFYIQMNISMLTSFILQLCKLVFCEAPPPFCMGERMKVIDAAVERMYVLRSATPPLLDLQGAMNFHTRDFDFDSLLVDFPVLGSSVMKIFCLRTSTLGTSLARTFLP